MQKKIDSDRKNYPITPIGLTFALPTIGFFAAILAIKLMALPTIAFTGSISILSLSLGIATVATAGLFAGVVLLSCLTGLAVFLATSKRKSRAATRTTQNALSAKNVHELTESSRRPNIDGPVEERENYSATNSSADSTEKMTYLEVATKTTQTSTRTMPVATITTQTSTRTTKASTVTKNDPVVPNKNHNNAFNFTGFAATQTTLTREDHNEILFKQMIAEKNEKTIIKITEENITEDRKKLLDAINVNCYDGVINIISHLVRRGYTGGDFLKLIDEYGFSPIHYAAKHKKTEAICAILDALKMATGNSNEDKLKELICFVVNYQEPKGLTALQIACIENDKESANVLLQHGANINYQEPRDGWTALHIAYALQNKEIISLLEKNIHINENIKDKTGKMACDYKNYEQKPARRKLAANLPRYDYQQYQIVDEKHPDAKQMKFFAAMSFNFHELPYDSRLDTDKSPKLEDRRIQVLTDDGKAVAYNLFPFVDMIDPNAPNEVKSHDHGFKGAFALPEMIQSTNSPVDLYIFNRGTDGSHSSLQADLEKAPGSVTFDKNEEKFLQQLNAQIQKLNRDPELPITKVNIINGGHSLGASYAQHETTAILKTIARNKWHTILSDNPKLRDDITNTLKNTNDSSFVENFFKAYQDVLKLSDEQLIEFKKIFYVDHGVFYNGIDARQVKEFWLELNKEPKHGYEFITEDYIAHYFLRGANMPGTTKSKYTRGNAYAHLLAFAKSDFIDNTAHPIPFVTFNFINIVGDIIQHVAYGTLFANASSDWVNTNGIVANYGHLGIFNFIYQLSLLGTNTKREAHTIKLFNNQFCKDRGLPQIPSLYKIVSNDTKEGKEIISYALDWKYRLLIAQNWATQYVREFLHNKIAACRAKVDLTLSGFEETAHFINSEFPALTRAHEETINKNTGENKPIQQTNKNTGENKPIQQTNKKDNRTTYPEEVLGIKFNYQ